MQEVVLMAVQIQFFANYLHFSRHDAHKVAKLYYSGKYSTLKGQCHENCFQTETVGS